MVVMEDQRTVRVLVAGDNESTLLAIARFLRDEEYRVIGAVRDGAALVSGAVESMPDVAVVDIFMPEMSGLEATAQLRELHCDAKIVILTAHREPEFVEAAFAAGASAYVLKHRLVTDLPVAIE